MKNMFSGQSKKELPKTIDDCIRSDSITSNLWVWAERVEKIGSIVLAFILIVGIIDTITVGIDTYQGLTIFGEVSDGAVAATVFAILTNIFLFALYALVEYGIYHAVALGIAALARLVQNSNIRTNLKLYEKREKFSKEITEEPPEIKDVKPRKIKDEWYKERGIDPKSLNCESQAVTIIDNEKTYVDMKCPNCKHDISIEENGENIVCPWCDAILDNIK